MFGCDDDQFIRQLLQMMWAWLALQNMIHVYCQTWYGAIHFHLTWASNVVLSVLDFIWMKEIKTFINNSHAIFDDALSEIQAQDFEMIMQFLSVRDVKTLQLLFFLCEDDISNGNMMRELTLSSHISDIRLSSMQSFTTNNKTFQTRWPEFLSFLADTQYCTVYSFLSDN